MKLFPTVFVFLLLTACAANYQVAEVTDKFSDPTKPAVKSMVGNSIDLHDPLGSLPTSELNAYISTDRKTGKIVNIGFSAVFVNEAGSRWLNINPGNELVFLADDQRIVLNASTGSIDHKIVPNSISGPIRYNFDFAEYPATPDQILAVANAQKLEFKVSGISGSATFPSGKPLLESFQKNIKQFYDLEILKKY
jgi:hypothetical protein